MPARALALLAPLLLLAGSVAAQEISPLNRILVIDAGKKGTIKIKDVVGCKPSWTAESADESVATVTPEAAPSSKGRNFKVQAGDVPGQMTTVTVTLDGTGENCEETQQLVFTVVTVFKEKSAEKMTKKAGKQEAKSFKKFQKTAEKTLDQDLDGVLDQLAEDLAAVDAGEGGASPLEQKYALLRAAMIAGTSFYLQFMAVLLNTYVQFGDNIRFAAQQAIFNYAYLPVLAVTLLAGGGGIWDDAVAKLLQVGVASAIKATQQFRSFVFALAALAADFGAPLTTGFVDEVQALCFPDLCGPSASVLDSAAPTDTAELSAWTAAQQHALAMQIAAAEADEGLAFSFGPKLQLLFLAAWSQFLPLRGTIFVGGLADPDDGAIAVVARPFGQLTEFEGVVVFDADFGWWYAFIGDDGKDGFLDGGLYVVTVTQGAQVRERKIDVAVR